MSAVDKARAILGYYVTGRGSGHTDAMIDGARNSGDVLVVVANHECVDYIKHELPNARVISYDADVGRHLAGHHLPLLFDNFAIIRMLSELLDEIRLSKERADELAEILDSFSASVNRWKDKWQR